MTTASDSMGQKARALAENLYYAPDDQISCDKFIDKVSQALVSFAAEQVSEAVEKERKRCADIAEKERKRARGADDVGDVGDEASNIAYAILAPVPGGEVI